MVKFTRMIKNLLLLILFCIASVQLEAQVDVFEAARSGNIPQLKAMFALDADTINKENHSGHTPLIIAAYNNQLQAVNFLLENGADVSSQFDQGSALHGAAFKGYLEVVKVLVNYKAKVNEKDSNGTTPLIYATLFSHNEIAKLLVEKGGDPTIKDNTGQSALTYAKQLKNEVLLHLFMKCATNKIPDYEND